MRHRLLLLGLGLILLVTAPDLGAERRTTRELLEDLARSRDEVVRVAADYRASLERLLALQEREQARAAEAAVRRRALADQGLIARRDLEEAQRASAEASRTVAETRARMAEADAMVAEAVATVELAAEPAPAPGESRDTGHLLRFGGGARWSLADTGELSALFASRFGRALPVSAFGQTPVHDRLGFDHRAAVDVALHPDSPEGQGLIAVLRSRRIPFLAFRQALPGVATGAHIHIGEPSPRLAGR
jgi:hypothetical protein